MARSSSIAPSAVATLLSLVLLRRVPTAIYNDQSRYSRPHWPQALSGSSSIQSWRSHLSTAVVGTPAAEPDLSQLDSADAPGVLPANASGERAGT
jgi:hypothetical protein